MPVPPELEQLKDYVQLSEEVIRETIQEIAKAENDKNLSEKERNKEIENLSKNAIVEYIKLLKAMQTFFLKAIQFEFGHRARKWFEPLFTEKQGENMIRSILRARQRGRKRLDILH